MPKTPTVIYETVDSETVRKAFNETGVTMVRLGRRDKAFAQNIQFMFSARLERNGLYNIRENRKVIQRDVSREDAITFIADKATTITDPVLFGVIRDIVTREKPTVADVIQAVAQPSE